MKYYFLLALLLPISLLSQNKGITSETPGLNIISVPININRQEKGITNSLPAMNIKAVDESEPAIMKRTEIIQDNDVDFRKKWQIIPAGSTSVVKLDFSGLKLVNMSPELGLGRDVLDLVATTVPIWIQPALLDNLRRINPYRLHLFIDLIKNAEKNYLDEIAYQIAHLSPQTLNIINPQLLVKNVEYIYKIAPDLQYVELVEKDSEDDWFTTTTYHILNDGTPEWVEIPREIYYQWILMPKLSDEEPSMGVSVYNKFWREYVYNYADDGYPLLKDVIQDVEYMWDLKNHKWINKDTSGNKLPFGDSLFAVQTLGRWVAQTLPERAKQPRPVQPNQILRDHNGNCGELEDLLNAGTRTALLPVRSVGSWPGDHVWNELWWDGHWYYYQVSWACGATFIEKHHTYPHKGLISAWRADGYVEQINELYNPVCSLKIKVFDNHNKPIDGAEVVFFSASYRDTHADEFYLGSWQQTDENGELNILLGTDITYGYRLDAKIGHNPLPNNSIYSIRWNQLTEGGTVLQNLKISGDMPQTPLPTKINSTPENKYKIKIKFTLPYYILYGGGYWTADFKLDNHEWSDFRKSGHIDFYICDEENYQKYNQSIPFDAYIVHAGISDDSLEFILPGDDNYYLIFSNAGKLTVSQILQTDIKLLGNKGGDWEVIDSLNGVNNPTDINDNFRIANLNQVFISPNPATDYIDIAITGNRSLNESVKMYDVLGNVVLTFTPVRSLNGEEVKIDVSGLAKGVYFVQVGDRMYKFVKM
jgi:hypothetical protein